MFCLGYQVDGHGHGIGAVVGNDCGFRGAGKHVDATLP